MNQLVFIVVISIVQQLASQCGMVTHIEISTRAINLLPDGHALKTILKENQNDLQSGSVFPDWAYSVCVKADRASRLAHDSVFVSKYVEVLNRSGYQHKDQKQYARLVSFLMAIVSHQEADMLWHYGPNNIENKQQSFLKAMSSLGSYCEDRWDGYKDPTCHDIGDTAGDLYLSDRQSTNWQILGWNLPIAFLEQVYKELQYELDKTYMAECMTMFYLGTHLEYLVSRYLIQKYIRHTSFLKENIDQFYVGGLDNMATEVKQKWEYVYQLINATTTTQYPVQSQSQSYDNHQKYQQKYQEYSQNELVQELRSDLNVDYVFTDDGYLQANINSQNVDKHQLQSKYLKLVDPQYKYKYRYQQQQQSGLRNRMLLQQRQQYKYIEHPQSNSYFGYSQTVLDNQYVAVSAPGYSQTNIAYTGRLYVYKLEDIEEQKYSDHVQTIELEDDADSVLGRLGDSLTNYDVDGDGKEDIVVGIPNYGRLQQIQSVSHYYRKQYSGQVRIYLNRKDSYVHQYTVYSNHSYHNIGTSLAVCRYQNSTKILIGSQYAYTQQDEIGYQGEVVVFDIQQFQQAKEISIDQGYKITQNQKAQMFGSSIQCQNGYVFIGAAGNRYQSNYQASGAVFVYSLDNYQLVSSIVSDKDQSQFGSSIKVYQDLLIVSAKSQSNSDIHQGSVYIFSIEHILKQKQNDLNQSKASINCDIKESRFGSSLLIHKEKLIVGASMHNELFYGEIGHIYVFNSLSALSGTLSQNDAEQKVAGLQADSRFGFSLDSSGDRILIGAPFSYNNEQPEEIRYNGKMYIMNIR